MPRMKLLIQRVTQAHVCIAGVITAQIGQGMVVLIGVAAGDTPAQANSLAHKTAHLRIFGDKQDRLNRSLQDIEGEALVISQFTLCADTSKGHRPSFIAAAPPDLAEALYQTYVDALARLLNPGNVKTGRFRASMQVSLTNDGPVTLALSA